MVWQTAQRWFHAFAMNKCKHNAFPGKRHYSKECGATRLTVQKQSGKCFMLRVLPRL